MHKRYLLGTLPLLLCSCGGPLSLVSYTLAGGVAMNAKQEEFELSQREQYEEKCLPTHRKESPIAAGIRMEARGNLIKAYEYYSLGHYLGYREAAPMLNKLIPHMPPTDLEQAKKNMAKYKEIHIRTCFIPASANIQ